MSLLSNFELAERRKRQLEGLPINPTGVVLEKIVSPTEALINGKLAILAGTNNYLGLTFNQECIQAGIKSLETQGTGTTGSRMANGTYSGHLELEERLLSCIQCHIPWFSVLVILPILVLWLRC